MKFNKFIRSVNRIYNILFIALLVLALFGARYLYNSYISGTLFNDSYQTIYSISIICIFTVYFVLYIFRLIVNIISLFKLNNTIIKQEIEDELDNIRFKKDKIIITDNYLIVGAYFLKIIKLKEITTMYLSSNYKYESIKILNIICDNEQKYKRYIIYNYYSEEVFEYIKKHIATKKLNVSDRASKKDINKEEMNIIIFEILMLVLVLIIILTAKYLFQ